MEEKPILSLLWAGGKLGGAYFDLENSELFLMPDTPENALDFEMTRMIYRQVEPGTILINSSQDVRFLALVEELTKVGEVEEDVSVDGAGGGVGSPLVMSSSRGNASFETSSSRHSSVGIAETRSVDGIGEDIFGTPLASPSSSYSWDVQLGVTGSQQSNLGERATSGCQVIKLSYREFAPDPCKARLQAQRLPRELSSAEGDTDHLIFISSLISFKNIAMVRAAGALLKYLDKNGLSMFRLRMNRGMVFVEDIKIFNLEDLVLVDDAAWSSLQIFYAEEHPANTKYRAFRKPKEGLSIFGILNRCLTTQGSKMLKTILLRPTRNVQTLKRRFDVIGFCYNPFNTGFVKSACDSLKAIKSWPNLFTKIEGLHASANDWQAFYQTLHHFVIVADLSSRQSGSGSVELFRDLGEFTRVSRLRTLFEHMARTIDLEETKTNKRFTPKPGVNSLLDQIRRQYSCLPKIMTRVAQEEIKLLPVYIQQCSVIYMPEIGYLVAVPYWEENFSPEEVNLPGFDYKYSNDRIAYFKSRRTEELDEVLGDYQVTMIQEATSTMLTLTNSILAEKKTIMEMGQLIAELDCLIAMSKAAYEYNFIRPVIGSSSDRLEIVDGKHPLVCQSSFVPNSTEFAGQERLVILTGPNASGKSVYLKQVAIISLMALCGSFVPASSACIPSFDRICTKIHVLESVTTGLSTFLVDLNQMAFALRESTKSSLIIIDEFGKGTADNDGLALLKAALNNLIRRGSDCPTVFLSTHFCSLKMDPSPLLKYQTMKFSRENNSLVYLFKLTDGMCTNSFAAFTALQAGVSEAVIERFEEVHDILINGDGDLEKLKVPLTPKQDLFIGLAKEFLSLDLDAIDPVEYVKYIQRMVEPFRLKERTALEPTRQSGEPLETTFSAIESEDEVSSYFRPNALNMTTTSNSAAGTNLEEITPADSETTSPGSGEEEVPACPREVCLVSYARDSSQSQQCGLVHSDLPSSARSTDYSPNNYFGLVPNCSENYNTPVSDNCGGATPAAVSENSSPLSSSSICTRISNSTSCSDSPLPLGATAKNFDQNEHESFSAPALSSSMYFQSSPGCPSAIESPEGFYSLRNSSQVSTLDESQNDFETTLGRSEENDEFNPFVKLESSFSEPLFSGDETIDW